MNEARKNIWFDPTHPPTTHGRSAGAHQVADGFVLLVGHVDRSEFTGPIEPGELIGVAAVGLHAVGGFLGNERRRDDFARNAFVAQMAAQDKPARSGFVSKAQFEVIFGELVEEFVHGIEGAADDAVTADLGGVLRRDGNGDSFFVDVQADVMHDFVHGCLVSLSVINDPASCRVF